MGKRYPAPVVPFVEAQVKGDKQIPTLIVLSSSWTTSETGAALGIANAMHRSSVPAVSTHYVVDEAATYQCVWDHVVARHCGYDVGSIGIKMCDDPSLLLRRWNEKPHQRVLYRSADITAQLCLSYGIRPRFLTDEELSKWAKHKWRSRSGIVTSDKMSRVFGASDKQDLKDWPRYEFLYMVHDRMAAHRESK